MFLRKKANKSGSISIQVIEKKGRINKVLHTIGTSMDFFEIEQMWLEGLAFIDLKKSQSSLALYSEENNRWFAEVLSSIHQINLVGPELILGKIYDQIGFNTIQEPLFRQLVLSRIINPTSKLRTVRDIKDYYNLEYTVDKIYRFLDTISSTLNDQVQQISFQHTLGIFNNILSIVFYDVTTIYFEAEKEDDLRIAGFSKEGRHKHPQILLGLLVSIDGYPLAYDIFPGNTYEGHTMLPILDGFKSKYNLEKLVVVADSGLLTRNNIIQLDKNNYEFILGARIKNEKSSIINQILDFNRKDGQHIVITKENGHRLIIHYSEKRAKKDGYNRERGLKRLEKLLKSGKISKAQLNNKGYNKYLTMEGEIKISIDYKKYEKDQKWDGLKGYITNTSYDPQILLSNYGELWKIEKAFRISKTDLRIRPIYHRLHDRIEAHICISFASYKVYKELERQLKEKGSKYSINRSIELIKGIKQITLIHPISKIKKTTLLKPTDEQIYLIKLLEN